MKDYKTIKFNGVSLPVSFNRYALGKFMKSQNIGFDEFENLSQDLETLQQLVYHGILGGFAARDRKAPEMSYIDFCIEYASDDEALAEAMQLFSEQNAEPESEKKPKAPAKAKAKS